MMNNQTITERQIRALTNLKNLGKVSTVTVSICNIDGCIEVSHDLEEVNFHEYDGLGEDIEVLEELADSLRENLIESLLEGQEPPDDVCVNESLVHFKFNLNQKPFGLDIEVEQPVWQVTCRKKLRLTQSELIGDKIVMRGDLENEP